MHFGMAIAVDEPTEFYHSRCWASSNLSTFGEFARSTQGELIMVGDIVKFKAQEGFSRGRVQFVFRQALAGALIKGAFASASKSSSMKKK